MILWIGKAVPEQYIKDIFNVESIDKVDSRMVSKSNKIIKINNKLIF